MRCLKLDDLARDAQLAEALAGGVLAAGGDGHIEGAGYG